AARTRSRTKRRAGNSTIVRGRSKSASGTATNGSRTRACCEATNLSFGRGGATVCRCRRCRGSRRYREEQRGTLAPGRARVADTKRRPFRGERVHATGWQLQAAYGAEGQVEAARA